MNGLWKEKLGGWNHKDSKRKKQTRNNMYRDRGRQLIHAFDGYNRVNLADETVFRIEKAQRITYDAGNYVSPYSGELIPSKMVTRDFTHRSDKKFMYGKYLPNWKWYTFFGDGKRRGIAQRYANSKDRLRLREWIQKGDWDKDIPTHYLSKSIAWEVW